MNFEFKSLEELSSTSNMSNYGEFGLNDAKLTAIDYLPANFNGGTNQEALSMTFKVKDVDYNYRVFPARVYGNLDTNSSEYKDAYAKAESQVSTAFSQIAQAIVPAETIQSVLSSSTITSFKDFSEVIARVVKSTPGWNNKELQLFLHWQSKLGEGKSVTYLEVPKQTTLNYSNSVFVVAKQPGTWTSEINNVGALVYKNEQGQIHPIKRNKWYMGTNNAARIVLDNPAEQIQQNNPATSQEDTASSGESW